MKNMVQTDAFTEIVEAAKKALPSGAVIDVQQVDKLQGQSYTGMGVALENGVKAVVNLDPFCEMYEDGVDMADIITALRETVNEALNRAPKVNPENLIHWESVKKHIIPMLVPKEKNARILATCPHSFVADMACVYRIVVSDDEEGCASCVITDALMDTLDVSTRDIHNAALQNMIDNDECELMSMEDKLAAFTGYKQPGHCGLWVATRRSGMYGASVLINKKFLKLASMMLGGAFYILPSSIHEVLFVEFDKCDDIGFLRSTVQGVNEAELSDEDYLSDNVYRYNPDTEEVEVAEVECK